MTYDALEHDYSPSCYAHDFQGTLRRQAAAGQRLVERFAPRHLRYADDPAARMDLFVPKGDGAWPLMAFIHGGYWQELDHGAANFLAEYYLSRGMAFASLGYGLAPRVSIETMVTQCGEGLRLLRSRADAFGLTGSWVLGGHSAGAQLACRVAANEARAGDGVPIDTLVLVSGIYDLTPLVTTYVNKPLALDRRRARALSPFHDEPGCLPPMQIVIAEHDTPAFRRQGRDFLDAVRSAGGVAVLEDLEGCDHFDVLEHPRFASITALPGRAATL